MSERRLNKPDTEVTYNGWENYPTWAIHLWLSNEENSLAASRELLSDAGDPDRGAQDLHTWVEDNSPIPETSGMYVDIMSWALQIVDWDAVARALGPEAWGSPKDSSGDVS